VPAFVRDWEQLPLFASQATLPADVRERVRAQRLANNPVGLSNSLRGLGTGTQEPLWHRLGVLHTPTLLVAGDLDRTYCELAQQMASSLPAARIAIVAGAGHAVHLEKPAAFDAAVVGFLGERR
jgi:pimeloyl-ACP methyl ester carboxylesterase